MRDRENIVRKIEKIKVDKHVESNKFQGVGLVINIENNIAIVQTQRQQIPIRIQIKELRTY